MNFTSKLKYAICFAASFAVLTLISFLAGLFIVTQYAPPPIANSLLELFGFSPPIFIGALILGLAQAFLSLWVAQHHIRWFWLINVIIAIALGCLASFFSLQTLWIIWGLVTVANLLLNLLMLRFLELRQFKHVER